MLKKFLVLVVVCLLFAGCASSEEKAVDAYHKGQAYLAKGSTDEARIEAKNAIKLDPNMAEAYELLGDCSVKDQNWRGAFGAYSRAIELKPTLVQSQLGLGRIYLLSRQYDNAEQSAATVLNLEPENIDARLLRAGVLLQMGSLEEAQSVLQSILAQHPDNTDALIGLITTYEKMGDIELAESTLENALAENPDASILYFKAAALAEKRNDFSGAERYYTQLIDKSDNKDSVRMLLIKMFERSEQPLKAQSALREIITNNPDNIDYQLALAGLYLKNKQFDESLKVVNNLLIDNGDDVRLRLALVDIYLAKGDLDPARELLLELAESVADSPHAASVSAKLGAVYLKSKEYEKSLEAFDKSIQLNPVPQIIQLRAQAKLGLGDMEGAIADLRIVRKELPDNYQARYLLARAYLAQDKGLMAVEELHDILERNADYSPSRNLLVQYYARYGQWELAEEELGHLLEQTPKDASLLIAMGDVKRMRGQHALAIEYFKKALTVTDDSAPALLRLGMMAESAKQYDKALGFYEEVLAKHPQSAAGIERKLFSLAASGKKSALEAYKVQLLKDVPDSPVLHDVFGRLAFANNKTEEAEREFRKASELAPDWGVPYQHLIGVYLAKKDLDQVVEECKVAVSKRQDAFVEHFLLGQIYQMRGETQLAQSAYEATLAIRPHFMPAANNLAYLYAENYTDQAKLDEALRLAKIGAQKESPEALDTLGWIYNHRGNREQAMDALHKAYEKDPSNKTIAYHLAHVLAKWSHSTEARRIIEGALADDSQFPERDAMESLLQKL